MKALLFIYIICAAANASVVAYHASEGVDFDAPTVFYQLNCVGTEKNFSDCPHVNTNFCLRVGVEVTCPVPSTSNSVVHYRHAQLF